MFFAFLTFLIGAKFNSSLLVFTETFSSFSSLYSSFFPVTYVKGLFQRLSFNSCVKSFQSPERVLGASSSIFDFFDNTLASESTEFFNSEKSFLTIPCLPNSSINSANILSLSCFIIFTRGRIPNCVYLAIYQMFHT